MANNSYNDKVGRYELKTVGIEDVDAAVYDYFSKKLAITVDAGENRRKVEIIYVGGERWKQARKSKFRDENGTLILPIISIDRIDIDRTRGFGGMAQEVPQITISNIIHPKTGNMQNLLKTRRENRNYTFQRSTKVVREYLTIPFPDFATIHYKIEIWTQFQTQMNEILEKIWYSYEHMDSFVMPVDYDGENGNLPEGKGYYFVGFRDGNVMPQSNTEDFTDQERILKYVYNIRTPAYFILAPKDEPLSYGRDKDGKPVLTKYQNAVDISMEESIISYEDYEKLFG